jgi:hypothetical protein
METLIVLYCNPSNDLSQNAIKIIKKYDFNNIIIIKNVIEMIKNKKKIHKSLKTIPSIYVIENHFKDKSKNRFEIIESLEVIKYLKLLFRVDEKVLDNGGSEIGNDKFLSDYNRKLNIRKEKENEKISTNDKYNKDFNISKKKSLGSNENNLLNVIENNKKNVVVHRIKKDINERDSNLNLMQDKREKESREIKTGRKGHSIFKKNLINTDNKSILSLIEKGKNGTPIIINDKNIKKNKNIYS